MIIKTWYKRHICPCASTSSRIRFKRRKHLSDHHELLRSRYLNPGQSYFEIKVGFDGAADE